MSERRVYNVALCLRSPFMFEGTVNTRTGVDAAFLRDSEGHPVIPSTQIRGVLRAALITLNAATSGGVINILEINALFGEKSTGEEVGQDTPIRACAVFGDLTGPKPDRDLQTTRIKIDEETGTVAKGALQVIELAAPLGSECVFKGSLVIRFGRDLDIARIENALNKAMALVPSIGAYKSAGFGEVVKETSAIAEDAAARTPLVPKEINTSAGRRWFDVVLDRPLLVDAHRLAENIFESATIIPGAAIKGALAQRLELAGLLNDAALSDALTRMRISHAFPIDANTGRRLELPLGLSLLRTDAGLADAIGSGLSQAPLRGGEAVSLLADCKQGDVTNARDALGLRRLEVARLSRTHVKIDEEKLSAVPTKLFATVAVSHKHGNGQQVRWRFCVDFDGGAPTGIVSALLAGPLDGLGRSAAIATLEASGAPADMAAGELAGDANLVDIILQTPAMLTGPRMGNDAQQSIFEAHRDYFEEFLDGAKLVNLFAERTMAGGYIATRRRPYGADTYYPFILTTPGSVFRLDVSAKGARAALENALGSGLPAVKLNGKTVTWRNCAYVPENGYGEIALYSPKVQDCVSLGISFEGGI
jgi:RAMP superfamily